jgi:hypothetical protein
MSTASNQKSTCCSTRFIDPSATRSESSSSRFVLQLDGARSGRFRGHIDDFRVYARALKQDEISVLAMGETLNEIAHKPEQQRSEIEEFQLRSYYLENIAPQEVRDAGRQLADLLDEKDKFERGLPSVMVMAVSPAPRPTF